MAEAYLDYDGTADDKEPKQYTHSALKTVWTSCKKYNYQWTMKDQTLLSRMMKEYDVADIGEMIVKYSVKQPDATFGQFYLARHSIHRELFKPDDYGY